jgi:hypothetical protein
MAGHFSNRGSIDFYGWAGRAYRAQTRANKRSQQVSSSILKGPIDPVRITFFLIAHVKPPQGTLRCPAKLRLGRIKMV